VPDPFDDVDALEELEEEITTLAAHIHAATHRLLTLIAEFDRRRGWELGGHRTCAHWLHARTGSPMQPTKAICWNWPETAPRPSWSTWSGPSGGGAGRTRQRWSGRDTRAAPFRCSPTTTGCTW
jgi:hypothetical protein